MGNHKITLLRIFLMKEKIHWQRIGKLWLEMNWEIGGILVAFPIIAILVCFAHYAFSFMHTAFEIFMYFTKREQFNANMKNIYEKTNAILNPKKEVQLSPVTLNIPKRPVCYSANGRID